MLRLPADKKRYVLDVGNLFLESIPEILFEACKDSLSCLVCEPPYGALQECKDVSVEKGDVVFHDVRVKQFTFFDARLDSFRDILQRSR